MDSQITSRAPPERPDSSTATLHDATIDKPERNEISNAAREIVQNDYTFTTEGENTVLESSDIIDFIRNAVQPLLAAIRKNDQSRSTVGEQTGKDSSNPIPQAITTDKTASHPSSTGYIIDVAPPPIPPSLPVTGIADRYTRSMLKCFLGYPLYNPTPFSELSKEYPRNGVNVGDVGFVRGSGTFDFLFNICLSQNGPTNPSNLPGGFSLETPNHSATTNLEPLPQNTCLFQSPITKTRSGEYICEGSGGAVLELPQGAIQDEAAHTGPFEKLAARHGVQWYEYTMTRCRDISNGSLYLITSVIRCSQWGIAVFDRPCAPEQGLKFDKRRSLPFGKSASGYHWKGSRGFCTKVFNPDQGDAANQCVFVRGYKIMIRQDIFDNLCSDQPRRSDPAIPSSSRAGSSSMTRQRTTRISGGGGSNLVSRLTSANLFSRTTNTKSDEETVLHPNFNSSLVHPSDLINTELLNQNLDAKVALTHDDVWCNLLRDNFPKFDYATLINIARSYTTTVEHDCVSLEKISNPSSVLSHSLQETETPALQGPLTPPDDDYSVPATIFLTLPLELVERILLLLDPKSLLKCRLVNKVFNAIIQSSTLVQYYLACEAAGVIDNPQSPLSYVERHEALKKREDAWRKLKPLFETTVNTTDLSSTLYELTAGNYFLSDHNRRDLYCYRLPSSPQDKPQWLRIPGHGPVQSWSGSIVEIGVAIYEHDLVVNVISSEVGNQTGMRRHSLDLVLLKFSTGEYHPLARHPLIHVQRSLLALPYICVKITSDHLALVVHDLLDGSRLLVFDWKTGHKRLQHTSTEGAYEYSVPVFVSPEVLLVPNLILSCFEVWHLLPSHPNPSPPVQILSLQLPDVSTNYSIIGINCHGEPSPFLHSMSYFPPRPFFPSSENSIIIVKLLLRSLPGLRKAYKLVMHRRVLLDMIQKLISPSLEQDEGLRTWFKNEVTLHKLADPDDGSVTRLGAVSKLVSPRRHAGLFPRTRDSPALATSSYSLTSQISAEFSSISSGSASFTSQYEIIRVDWADWGPSVSRWFQENKTHRGFINQSAGQRYAFLGPNPRDKTKCIVCIADFNLHNVRRNTEIMMAQLRGEGGDNGSNDNNREGKKVEEEELEKLDHEGAFKEEVYMGLKCVVYDAPGEYDFDILLMDEERLLGFKTHPSGIVERIKVLHFG